MAQETGQSETGQFDLRDLLRETRVGALSLTRVPSLPPTATLDEAAAQMRKVSHGSALICKNEILIGIITERDLLRLLATDADFEAPVSESMTASPKTVTAEDRLLDAVQLMDRGGYRRLPVVNEKGCPTGIVDVKTVMSYLVDQVPTTVYNQASSALLTVRSAEGA